MEKANCFIITGTVGAGKTTLIDALVAVRRYRIIPEIARQLVHEEMAKGASGALPWTNRPRFEELLLARRISAFAAITPDEIWVCDRGIPETIAFFKSDTYEVPPTFVDASREYRYNRAVFVLPPWREIYQNRPERPQSFGHAERIGELIVQTYRELGYETIDVPKMSISDRVKFVGDVIEARVR